jgi:hypothetical protein
MTAKEYIKSLSDKKGTTLLTDRTEEESLDILIASHKRLLESKVNAIEVFENQTKVLNNLIIKLTKTAEL